MNDDIAAIMAERELARRNLEYYQKYIFKYQYQLPLRENWHHGYLSEILMAAFNGELDRFIINMPPSYGKTEMVVRQFVSWALGKNPRKRFAYTTYGDDVSTPTSIQTRNIVESKVYKGLFPDVQMSKVLNKNNEWETSVGGGLFATTTGGAFTGKHVDGIIMDDPLKAIDADSPAKHKESIDFYTGTILTRLRDKNSSFIGLIMQRLNIKDLAGYLMASEERDDWEVFVLRGEEERGKIYEFGNFRYERKPGEPLDASKEDMAQLQRMKRSMGQSKYDTQYQQDPEPKEAGFVQPEWFSDISAFDMPKKQSLYIKIDPAMSQKKSADDRAIVVVGYSIDEEEIELKVVMDCWHGKWGIDEFVGYIADAMMSYPSAQVLLESSGGGLLVDPALKKEIMRRNAKFKKEGHALMAPHITTYTPSNKTSKVSKIMFGIAELEAGRVKFRRGANGIEQIKSEYLRFDPNREHNRDNCIDALHSGEEHCRPERNAEVKKKPHPKKRGNVGQGRGKWRF